MLTLPDAPPRVALVPVDGIVRGNTPTLRVLELSVGRHMLTVTHPAFGTTQKFVIVRPRAQVRARR